MDYNKISSRIASRLLVAEEPHDPDTDLELVIGRFTSEMFGITDASTEYFQDVTTRVTELLDAADLELDLDDDAVYPYIRKAVIAAIDEMGLAE